MQNDPKIVERYRRLLRLAQDPNASRAERAAAWTRLQRMEDEFPGVGKAASMPPREDPRVRPLAPGVQAAVDPILAWGRQVAAGVAGNVASHARARAEARAAEAGERINQWIDGVIMGKAKKAVDYSDDFLCEAEEVVDGETGDVVCITLEVPVAWVEEDEAAFTAHLTAEVLSEVKRALEEQEEGDDEEEED